MSTPMRTALTAAAALAAMVALALRRRKSDEDQDDWTECGGAQLVGHTPLIKLRSLSKLCGCDVYAKCEHLNPNGTGKDRVALAMIRRAEDSGALPRGGGGYIIEGSSGSTTLALAPLVAAAGHRLVAVIPDDCAAEKRDAVKACPGVDVHVVKSAAISSPTHYVNVARRLTKELREKGKHVIFADQFDNPANFHTHLETAKEIQAELGRIDAFVMGAGTGGTLAGCSRVFSNARIYLADPQGSALHAKVRHGVCYDTNQAEQRVRRHRYDTIADGIGLDRVTANFREARIDDAIRVSDADALVMAHYLLRFEGLFLGSSSALNCVAALRAGAELRKGTDAPLTIVTVLCDGGARYLSRFWSREFVEARGLVWPPADGGALAGLAARLVAREPGEGALL